MNYQQNREKMELKIYRRLLKYSPFAPTRSSLGTGHKVIHRLKNGATITASAVDVVTVSDAEKLYSAIFCKYSEERGEKYVTFKAKIRDIQKMTNCKDPEYIFNCIEKITKLSIVYDNFFKRKVFHVVGDAEFERELGEIKIEMPIETYNSFLNKALTLNLKKFIELRPITKNLYGFITSNSSLEFREDLLIERTASASERKDKAQSILKKALVELKNNYIIQDFKIEKKNKVRFIILKKNQIKKLP